MLPFLEYLLLKISVCCRKLDTSTRLRYLNITDFPVLYTIEKLSGLENHGKNMYDGNFCMRKTLSVTKLEPCNFPTIFPGVIFVFNVAILQESLMFFPIRKYSMPIVTYFQWPCL